MCLLDPGYVHTNKTPLTIKFVLPQQSRQTIILKINVVTFTTIITINMSIIRWEFAFLNWGFFHDRDGLIAIFEHDFGLVTRGEVATW